jgi:hypothetical protein
MSKEDDRCVIKHCRSIGDVVYYGRQLCNKHWEHYMNQPSEKLKKILNIKMEKKNE